MNTNFLYYASPANELQTHYGDDFEQPFKHKITTQWPKNIVVIRLAAIAVFGALLVLISPVWIWPVVVIGTVAYAGWTIYSHVLRKDPLVEMFYKIVGGKDQYDNLPEIVLAGEKTVEENINDLSWNALDQPAYRAETKDGRRIFIVRALSRNPEQDIGFSAQVKTIFTLVEKLGPADLISPKDLSPENNCLFESLIHGLNLRKNDNTFRSFRFDSSFSGGSGSIRRKYFLSSLETDIANEFFAQMS